MSYLEVSSNLLLPRLWQTVSTSRKVEDVLDSWLCNAPVYVAVIGVVEEEETLLFSPTRHALKYSVKSRYECDCNFGYFDSVEPKSFIL